ncbi:MAG: homocysteine S-methyltransferase family protein, partial [Chloroflexi bacterium]|nr:homocysteine S-methyltransferase family protein [Chloroflexota bacterium]
HRAGAQIVGACCGSGPAHTEALARESRVATER